MQGILMAVMMPALQQSVLVRMVVDLDVGNDLGH